MPQSLCLMPTNSYKRLDKFVLPIVWSTVLPHGTVYEIFFLPIYGSGFLYEITSITQWSSHVTRHAMSFWQPFLVSHLLALSLSLALFFVLTFTLPSYLPNRPNQQLDTVLRCDRILHFDTQTQSRKGRWRCKLWQSQG